MKTLFTTVVFNLFTLLMQGQTGVGVVNNRFVPKVDTIAEALVEMALKNAPSIRSAKNMAASSRYIYSRSKTTWLNNITAVGNLNEFTINPRPERNVFFPRYNFGVQLPLGIFFNNPKQTKVDYYQYKATEEQVDMEERAIRQQVLSLYQDYILSTKLKSIQIQIVNDYSILATKNEERFVAGQLTLEAYTNSNIQYYNAMTQQVTIERDIEVTKAKLEELIGMNLEQAIDQIVNGTTDK